VIPTALQEELSLSNPAQAKEEAKQILFYHRGSDSYREEDSNLFRETQHTEEDVDKAKKWLRHNHDVSRTLKSLKPLYNLGFLRIFIK
jgi:hypothetical protein